MVISTHGLSVGVQVQYFQSTIHRELGPSGCRSTERTIVRCRGWVATTEHSMTGVMNERGAVCRFV